MERRPWRGRVVAWEIVEFLLSTPPGTTVMIASATDLDAREMMKELKAVCRARGLVDMEKTLRMKKTQAVESYWTGGE